VKNGVMYDEDRNKRGRVSKCC